MKRMQLIRVHQRSEGFADVHDARVRIFEWLSSDDGSRSPFSGFVVEGNAEDAFSLRKVELPAGGVLHNPIEPSPIVAKTRIVGPRCQGIHDRVVQDLL